jgi:hypothetical protein
MKPFGIVLASVLLLTPISFAAAPATQPSLEKENAQLKMRIAELESKVLDLQAQVKRLQQAPRLGAAPLVPGPLRFNFKEGRYEVLPREAPMAGQPAPLATPAAPPNWVPQQFNGQPYYLIPLAEQSAGGSK